MNATETWAEYVYANRDRFKWGTLAYHSLGELTRENGSIFRVDPYALADDEHYIGAWLTGLGYVGVRFPKATSRDLTDVEIEFLAEHPVVIA